MSPRWIILRVISLFPMAEGHPGVEIMDLHMSRMTIRFRVPLCDHIMVLFTLIPRSRTSSPLPSLHEVFLWGSGMHVGLGNNQNFHFKSYRAVNQADHSSRHVISIRAKCCRFLNYGVLIAYGFKQAVIIIPTALCDVSDTDIGR